MFYYLNITLTNNLFSLKINNKSTFINTLELIAIKLPVAGDHTSGDAALRCTSEAAARVG